MHWWCAMGRGLMREKRAIWQHHTRNSVLYVPASSTANIRQERKKAVLTCHPIHLQHWVRPCSGLPPCMVRLVSLWPFVSWPTLPQATSPFLSCSFISVLWHSVHYPHTQQKDNLCQGQGRLIVSFGKKLHYHMLILVQMRSKGDVLPVEQKSCGSRRHVGALWCSPPWASTLHRFRPAATEHLSITPTASCTWGEILPKVVSMEEYKTEPDGQEKKRK